VSDRVKKKQKSKGRGGGLGRPKGLAKDSPEKKTRGGEAHTGGKARKLKTPSEPREEKGNDTREKRGPRKKL